MSACSAIRVPGPQGGSGTDGTDGTNGVNAFSLVAAQFSIPAQQDTVLVTLTDPAGNRWMAINQVVAVQTAGTGSTQVGYYGVVSKTSTNQVTLLNLRDDANGLYADNLDGTGVVAVGLYISPAGIQGPAGVAAAGFLEAANNLSDVDDATTSRSNLGLGSMAIQDDSAIAVTGGTITGITDLDVADGGTGSSTAAGARTNLGAAASGLATASGLTTSATDKVLGRSSALGGAVEEIACTSFGRSLIDDASAAVARETLGKVGIRYGLLGSASAIDANATADTAISMVSARYIVDTLTVENASLSLNTATAGLFTAAGGGGTTLAADQALAALTASAKFKNLTFQAVVGTDVRTETTLYFRIGTPQGAAATLNAWIFGWRVD